MAASSKPTAAEDQSDHGGTGGADIPPPVSSSLADIWGTALNAARDGWLDLPPKQESIPLLRLSAVLLRLSDMIYSVDASHIGSTTNIEVPLCGEDGDQIPIPATLLQFRAAVAGEGASDQMPEQFGLWSVSGVGLVVAFRGTASYEDVLVDVNIRPTPLKLDSKRTFGGAAPLQVHAGMYHGVQRHLGTIQSDIVAATAQLASRISDDLPGRTSQERRRTGASAQPSVWLTGHSLGGGYANCAALHLLANQSSIFGGGGGCMTFGAPMVLYAEDSSSMYATLDKLLVEARKASGSGAVSFHPLNFVNGSDVVPRLLGSSFADIHQSILEYYPFVGRLTSASRQTAKLYHPFGTYHMILGKQVRSLPHRSGTNSAVGDAEYCTRVHSLLDVRASVKAMLVPGAVKSPAHDHLLSSYTAGIRGTLDAATTAAEPEQTTCSPDLASLFRLPADGPRSEGIHEGLGRSVGQAGWSLASAAVGFAGRAAHTYMSQPARSGQPQPPQNETKPNTWGSWLK